MLIRPCSPQCFQRFLVPGDSVVALILLGYISIPLCLMKKPGNMSEVTPKARLSDSSLVDVS